MAHTLPEILREVAEARGLTPAYIRSPRLDHRATYARQEVMYLARRRTTLSFPQIGDFFAMHHTTVMHGVIAHEKRLANA